MDSRGKVVTNFNVIYAKLFGDEEKAKEKYQDILGKQAPLIQSERSIFVHGTDLKAPILNANEANFTEIIHKKLFKYGYRSIFPTQAHSWNEIVDGRSVTIVNNQNSGKTMTFLPPLLSLLSVKFETDEESSQGPIALIITNTSREVEALYSLCKQLLPNKDVKIVKAFGIWNFKDKCIELLNGCDLLITTPSCFTRFTECDTVRMFDRNRIRHLVLENLDLMYVKFKTDIQNILKTCTKGTESPHDNPQIIITATCWQDFLHSFSKFSTNPIIVIDEYIEAALFAKSRFTVARKSLKEKDQQLLNHLEQREWRLFKTAIVFTAQHEIVEFQGLLKNRSLSYEILDENTIDYEMEVWSRQAKGKMTMLLILDSILTRASIDSIQVLIHYSLPETWSAFSRRFALSLNYYKLYKDLPLKDKENQPRAIIILDENNVNEIPRLINFLSDRRLIQQIPANIQSESQKIINNMERAKLDGENAFIVPLCTNILKFGLCSRYKCKLRHAFITDDQPEFIPRSGRIKFKLIGMNSPLRLVATITDYLAPNSDKWISYHDKIQSINQALKDLQDYMSDDENQIMDVPKLGRLYAYLNTQTGHWRRCKIIKLEEKTESTSSRTALVEFVDVGGRSNVMTTTLLKLPDEIKVIDALACDIRIVNLIPYDCDEIFDRETIEVVEKYISKLHSRNDYLMCDIELAVGHTIITTNVTVHKKLNNINADIIKLSMRRYLLENNFALHENVLDLLMDIAALSKFYIPEEKIHKVESAAVEKPKEVEIKQQKSNLREPQISKADEEIHEENIRKQTEHFMKLLQDDENVNLFQSDANKMLGLPSTARFLPPKQIQELLMEPPKNMAIETTTISEQTVESVKNAPKILALLKRAREITKEPSKMDPATENVKESVQETTSDKQAASEKPKVKEVQLKNLFSKVNIEWNQNNEIVMLRMEAINLVEYSLKVTQTTCEIYIKYADEIALVNIEFYGRIIPKHVVHKSNDRYITMFLIKKFANIIWPRLTLSDEKTNNIKYSDEDLKLSFSQIEACNEPKNVWAPAGYFSDNEDDFFNEYDDNIENDEDQV